MPYGSARISPPSTAGPPRGLHHPPRTWLAAAWLACASCAGEDDDPGTVRRDDMLDDGSTSLGTVGSTTTSTTVDAPSEASSSDGDDTPPSDASTSTGTGFASSEDDTVGSSDDASHSGTSSDASTTTEDAAEESEGALPSESAQYQVARPIGSTDANAGYWEYLPPAYGSEPLPLLIALHGVDENGEGTASTLPDVLVTGIPMLIARDQWPMERPFVVLSPQFSGQYCPDPRWVATFIEYAIGQYDIDPARVYLTGLSCGAYGVWNYLASYLDRHIAAAVPIAGDGQSAWEQAGCDLGLVPIWAFHGDADSRVAPRGTMVPVGHLQSCDPAPTDLRVTTYLGVGHDSWSRTYDLSAGHDIYAWMLNHTRRD